MRSKTITIRDRDKIYYRGPERRVEQTLNEPRVFGIFTSRDIAAGLSYIISVVLTIAVFWVKTENRIDLLEKGVNELRKANEDYAEYIKSADIWHSTLIGTEFKGGRPINPYFDAKKKK
jgi:hypothetical protein